jgi:protein ImuB
MLWLCISLPQLPLEALYCSDADEAVVVTVTKGSARWIICCNSAAARAGLQPEMNFTVALALHPKIAKFERKLSAEQTALTRLAAWAYQFSGTVVLGEASQEPLRARTAAIWLEIGASLKLFGGFRKLIEHLESELGKLQYTYCLGIAPTIEGAALLARADIRVATTTLPALRMRIDRLPISKLALEPQIAEQLHVSGIRTVGLLLELPRAALAQRFGVDICNYLDRIVAAAPDPRPVFELPATYDATFEFELAVGNTEALLFPLRRMLREFAGFLRARDTGVQRFTLTLAHRQPPATTLRVGLSMPERNAERFFALVREHLERTSLTSPVTALSLSATEFTAPTALQMDAIDGTARQTEELTHTIDRLVARLGREQVHGLSIHADHRPEASWTIAEYDSEATAAIPGHERLDPSPFPDRPLWLLPQPKPLQSSVMPHVVSGPERIEGGWWDGGDVQRDYFIVRTPGNAALWVFRNLSDGSWHLHGFWS